MWKIIIIGILISCFSCRQEEELLTEWSDKELQKDRIPVNFSFSVHTETAVFTGTEIKPMDTRATAGTVTTRLENTFKGILLKEINHCWYVDTLVTAQLDSKQKPWNLLYITDQTIVSNWQIELRPGNYRLIAVLNPSSVTWNPTLTSGRLIKDISKPNDTIPYAFTYRYSTSSFNKGERQLSKEIFVGIKEFSVRKSDDLHSDRTKELTVDFTRQVMKFRLMLRKYTPPTAGSAVVFPNTQHFFHATLRTQDEKGFCQGITSWGEAYYPALSPVKEMKYTSTAISEWFQGNDNENYYIIRPDNSTVPHLFLLTGGQDNPSISYQLDDILITTSSPGIIYVHDSPIKGLKILPNGIGGVVFRPADIPLEYSEEYPAGKGVLEYLPEANPADILDDYCEWNL